MVCIYSTFLQRCFDQIFQEVALQNLPVVFCVDRAGMVGSDGPTHHGLMDIGFLRMMPNMVLVAPATEEEVKLALEFALSSNKPVVIRYPKDVIPEGLDSEIIRACSEPFELGESVPILEGTNSSVAIVSYGPVLAEAVTAAKQLKAAGVEVDVINARFSAPVDKKIALLLDGGKNIITVEDHRLCCGFGSAVGEKATARNGVGTPKVLRMLGVGREFVRHDSRVNQLNKVGITADKIAQAVRELIVDFR